MVSVFLLKLFLLPVRSMDILHKMIDFQLPQWILPTVFWTILLAGVLFAYLCFPILAVRHIPCPPYAFPGLGHLPLLNKLGGEVFMKLARQYGPLYRFHMGRKPLVIIADAELCRELCIKQFKIAPDRSPPAYIDSVPVLNRGLFFMRGPKWPPLRSIIQPFFNADHMHYYVPSITRVSNNLIDVLATTQEDEDVNISDYMSTLAMEVIGEAAFGAKFSLVKNGSNNSPDASRTSRLMEYATRFIAALRLDKGAPLSTVVALFFPFLQLPVRMVMGKIPGTGDWDQEICAERMAEILSEIVERRKQEGIDSRMDSLSLLLNAQKTASHLLTDDYLGGLTMEIMLAGSETTAANLSFALYLVSGHPEVERKLLKEIDAFGPHDRTPTFEELQQFPYAEQVIKEALRYYTPSPVVARGLLEDMELGGYKLKKGTAIWIAMDALLWDPKDFPEPEKFRPERFDPECEESKRRHPNAFSPFGMGRRMCIGYKFAQQEAKMALILLYQRFTFEHSPAMEKPLAMNFSITRRPQHGVRLRVRRRI